MKQLNFKYNFSFITLSVLIACFFGFAIASAENNVQTPDNNNQTSTTTDPNLNITTPTSTTTEITNETSDNITSTPDNTTNTTSTEQTTSSTNDFSTSTTSTPDTTSTTSTEQITTSSTTSTIITSSTTSTTSAETASSTTSTTSTADTNTSQNTSDTSTTTPPVVNIFINSTEISSAVNKLLNYLRSVQSESGMINDGSVSDWSIISFGANNQYADEIKQAEKNSLLDYEKKYNLDDPANDLNSCASYPRHIIALLAAGVDKNDPAIIGLKNNMLTICHKDSLYGLPGINDDVFALLGLLAIDIPISESIIIDTVNTIKADQTNDGAFTWSGWAGADMTGAAINALKYAQNKGINIDNNIFTKAKNYLKNNQLEDGGWGYGVSDILTTSWALMGINATGEGQNEWFTKTGTNPWHPLVNQLKNNNFYESAWVPGTVDWFAMKHSVPALLGKSWPIILPAKVQNFSTGGSLSYIYVVPISETSTTTPTTTPTTTTLDISTTTLEITTTTPEIFTTSTTTTTLLSDDIIIPVLTTQNVTTLINTTTPKRLTVLPSINNQTNNLESNTQKIDSTNTTFSTGTIISATPANLPANNSKTVFGVSLTAASGLGLFLAWKFIQTLI